MDDAKLAKDIKKFGFTVLLIGASDYLPSFGYTVGLWKNFKQPEIIAFGLSTDNLQTLLDFLAERVKAGEKFELNRVYTDFFDAGRSEFVKVDPRSVADYFGVAIDYYCTHDFPAIELVWTDREGHFPWEKGFDKELLYRQPLLDRNADFKFGESKNLGVFTTRAYVEQGAPILHVIHDRDGDWQFLTGIRTQDDGMLISLGSIIQADLTLNEVFDLDYGEQAERSSVGGEWTRSDLEE